MNTEAPEIVLIERDAVTLELYQRELAKSFTVFAFTGTADVLETLAKRDIRAVIIEPEIQSGTGWELIHLIRAVFPARGIPVIVCSTRDPLGAYLAPDVAKYLTKPVLPRALRDETLEILGSKDAARMSS